MSYKSIDLQSSLPRTQELTPMQQHQLQRSANDQSLLGQQGVKHAEQQASRSAKTESSARSGVSDRQSGGRQGESPKRDSSSNDQEPEQNRPAEHPYKGKHIDFSG